MAPAPFPEAQTALPEAAGQLPAFAKDAHGRLPHGGRALIKANLRGTVPKLELPGFLISLFGVLRWSHALMNYAKKSTDVRIYPG